MPAALSPFLPPLPDYYSQSHTVFLFASLPGQGEDQEGGGGRRRCTRSERSASHNENNGVCEVVAESALSQWFKDRFGAGGKRLRRTAMWRWHVSY